MIFPLRPFVAISLVFLKTGSHKGDVHWCWFGRNGKNLYLYLFKDDLMMISLYKTGWGGGGSKGYSCYLFFGKPNYIKKGWQWLSGRAGWRFERTHVPEFLSRWTQRHSSWALNLFPEALNVNFPTLAPSMNPLRYMLQPETLWVSRLGKHRSFVKLQRCFFSLFSRLSFCQTLDGWMWTTTRNHLLLQKCFYFQYFNNILSMKCGDFPPATLSACVPGRRDCTFTHVMAVSC